jgi:hypothetical protein
MRHTRRQRQAHTASTKHKAQAPPSSVWMSKFHPPQTSPSKGTATTAKSKYDKAMFDLTKWPFNNPKTSENEGRSTRNNWYPILADLHSKAIQHKDANGNVVRTVNLPAYETYISNYLGSKVMNDGSYVAADNKAYWSRNYLNLYNKIANGGTVDYLNNPFNKQLNALGKIYGGGDSDVQFSDDFKTSMSDISGFAKTMQQLSDPSVNTNGNVTINRVTVASGDPVADERINAILNNTYRVRAERVEYLLEQVLIKMDNIDTSGTGGSGTTATPEMFTNDGIPAAVERLSRG